MKKTIFAKITLFAFSFFLLAQATFAIGITPTRTELDLAPGESEEVTLELLNKSDGDIAAAPNVSVFLSHDEQGFPVPLELSESDVHNIRNWIDVSEDPTYIPAGGTTEVTFTVNIPREAEPGGKYVTISYFPVKGLPTEGVGLIATVASLLLINVKGDIILSGNIDSFGLTDRINSDEAFYFPVKFANTGNTHVKPAGWIEIIDKATGESLKGIATYINEGGVTVTSDKIPVNIHGGNVLPDSKRIFNSEWMNNIQTGEFTAILSLKYKDDMEFMTQEIDFEIIEDLNVDSFIINAGETESSFTLTVTNNGNIHERIIGSIGITNEFGYTVSEIAIPEDIDYIAPNETKTFTFDWLTTEVPTGRYKAKLNATHGLTDSEITAKVVFGEIDYTTYLLVGVLLVLLLILIVVIAKRKRR